MLHRLLILFALLCPLSAYAADNATLITPCGSGCVTMRSKDVGVGVQSMIQILGDTSGNAIYGTAGSSNSNVLSVQGIASGTALPVSAASLPLPTGAATSANQSTNGATTSHTCSVAGFSELGCLGQLDDDVKATGTVNPGTAANWGVGATGSAVPANAIYNGTLASSSEPTKATTGNLTGIFADLTGKVVTSPYANRENQWTGYGSQTGTSAITLKSAGGAGVKTYLTDLVCTRNDAGTSAISVTLTDVNATVIDVPDSGGGGGFSIHYNVPLVTAAATALTATPSAGVTTLHCHGAGFSGY